MRVAGGTRLKVFESMASGTPVVSTAVGVEGLPVVDGRHYLRADDPRAFATAVVRLMRDDALRTSIASEARAYVESRFSFRVAAQAFEDACVRAMELHQATACRRSR
jgi:glycosyltransferase involved in cell wall biosynthesis